MATDNKVIPYNGVTDKDIRNALKKFKATDLLPNLDRVAGHAKMQIPATRKELDTELDRLDAEGKKLLADYQKRQAKQDPSWTAQKKLHDETFEKYNAVLKQKENLEKLSSIGSTGNAYEDYIKVNPVGHNISKELSFQSLGANLIKYEAMERLIRSAKRSDNDIEKQALKKLQQNRDALKKDLLASIPQIEAKFKTIERTEFMENKKLEQHRAMEPFEKAVDDAQKVVKDKESSIGADQIRLKSMQGDRDNSQQKINEIKSGLTFFKKVLQFFGAGKSPDQKNLEAQLKVQDKDIGVIQKTIKTKTKELGELNKNLGKTEKSRNDFRTKQAKEMEKSIPALFEKEYKTKHVLVKPVPPSTPRPSVSEPVIPKAVEAPKVVVLPKVEAPKVEAPKVEIPKQVEAPKVVEVVKVTTPPVEVVPLPPKPPSIEAVASAPIEPKLEAIVPQAPEVKLDTPLPIPQGSSAKVSPISHAKGLFDSIKQGVQLKHTDPTTLTGDKPKPEVKDVLKDSLSEYRQKVAPDDEDKDDDVDEDFKEGYVAPPTSASRPKK